jgi:ferric-dicitrate binding protein FerR (iron transport regulator)
MRAQRESQDAPSAEDRARAIAQIERAIHRANRRRFAWRSLSAAAAVLLLGFGVSRYAMHHMTPLVGPTANGSSAVMVVGRPIGGGATVLGTGAPVALVDGRSLSSGSRILAGPEGRAALTLSTGSQLTVEEGGDVSIDESDASQIFAVRAGALRAHVAKLEAQQRFIVRTPDSEVEVRGTSFHVAVVESDPACGEGTITRVSVDEGVVTVRHGRDEARVSAGQEWPSGCVARVSVPTVARPGKGANAVPAPHVTGGAPAPSAAESSPAGSDLGEQNDSFARALAAKRRGATTEAIEAFESFVARYPQSPLVESALAQRMQLLRVSDPSRASAAAEQYLARYPKGFARAEAESIKRQSP